MRLINIDKLPVKKLYAADETGTGIVVYAVDVNDIKAAPTIDAVPVRHGRWKKESGYVCGDYQFFCSFCGEEFWESGYWPKRAKYCPNCGAKMDLEDKND